MALIKQVDTSTLSNQNISAALLVHTFTNTTRIRKLFVNMFIDQVAGNGDYIAHMTVQRSGAGSAYTSIKTTLALASGVTSGYFGSIPVTIGATDVLKVYVIGLAGDTTTPDIITDVNEEAFDATDLLDFAAGVETSFTVRQALRLILSALAGKLSGATTTTVTVRDVNDAKNRIVATVDSSGNRSAITTDVT